MASMTLYRFLSDRPRGRDRPRQHFQQNLRNDYATKSDPKQYLILQKKFLLCNDQSKISCISFFVRLQFAIPGNLRSSKCGPTTVANQHSTIVIYHSIVVVLLVNFQSDRTSLRKSVGWSTFNLKIWKVRPSKLESYKNHNISNKWQTSFYLYVIHFISF